MESTNLRKLIFYVIVIIFIIILIEIEKRDLYCTDLSKEQCGSGNGSAYILGKAEPNDTTDQILDKIIITSKYEYNTIVWRRFLITSFILSFVVLLVIKREIPSPIDFMVAAIIIYGGIYLGNEFAKHNITYYAVKQTDYDVELLRSKI